MTTRATIWAIFSGVLVLVLVGFFAMRAGMQTDRTETESRPEASATDLPSSSGPSEPAVIDDGSAWPMFGAGQGLVAQASSTLGEALSLLWRFKTGAEVKSSAAISQGRVYIGSSDTNVYALDLQTGERLWSQATGDVIEASPCVIGGIVSVGSSDGFLYAFDAETGDLRWKYETDGEILGAANWTRSPDGEAIWILVGSYDNRVHCVDSGSGQAVWTYETDNYVNGSPAIADGKCVFGGCDALIHAVAVADGSKVTEIDSGSYIASSAAFIDGQVYVGNYDNGFLRADIDRGEIIWEHTESEDAIFSSPAVTDSMVIFGSRDNLVRALRRADGQEVWSFRTLGEVDSSPAVSGDKVVFGSGDGRVYMLRLTDGKQLWSYEIGQPVMSSPAVAQGRVVIGCDDGYVYAFGSAPASEVTVK